MAGDIVLNPGAGGAILLTDQVAGIDAQVVKLGVSDAGVVPVQVGPSNPLPVTLSGAQSVSVSNFPATQAVSVAAPVTVAQSTAANLNATVTGAITANQGGAWSVSITGAVAATQSGAWTTGRTWTLAAATDSVAVSNFPVTATTPALIQNDDRQYDDEGFPYVNPNVPGADIATGDKQTQQLTALQAIQAGVTVLNPVSTISVSNLPATQNVNVTNPSLTVTGSLATTAPATPTVTQDDDKQYDDDGFPYVNTNVPGADIATGDKQTQQLAALTQLVNLSSSIIDYSATGVLTAVGTPIQISGINGISSGLVQLSGTWVGTVQLEASLDNFNTFTTLATTQTAAIPTAPSAAPLTQNGFYRVLGATSYNQVRARALTLVSGAIGVALKFTAGNGLQPVISTVAAGFLTTSTIDQSVPGTSNAVAVTNLTSNPALETAGQLQRLGDLMELAILELRVISAVVASNGQPIPLDPERIRADFVLTLQ